jgi:tetratricopeptide (TPR) repeat protein
MLSPNMIKKTIQQAKKAYNNGNYLQAADLFAQAGKNYAEIGDEVNLAEMKNNQSVALLMTGHAKAALEAASGTEVIFQGIQDRQREALAIGNQAAALEEMGQNEAALEKYILSASLLKNHDENEMRPYILKKISNLQLKSGDQIGALAAMNSALSEQTKLSAKERFLKKIIHLPFKFQKK